MPTETTPGEIEETVIAEIRRRRDVGRKKYGVTMERTDLTRKQWLQHAQDEVLDAAIYLEKLKREDDRWNELCMRANGIIKLAVSGSLMNEDNVRQWLADYSKAVLESVK